MAQLVSISCTKNRKFEGIVRSHALGNELLGKLGFIRFQPDKAKEEYITVLCQVTSVDRRNTVHEDPSFGPVIANQGQLPYLSDIGDFEQAVIKPIAQQVNGKIAALRANPPSGTAIVSLDDQSVSEKGNAQQVFNSFASVSSKYLRYGGTIVGEPIRVPFICKSFNPKLKEGWGEARHAGFFGRSGSGKTHAAKIMLAMNLVSTTAMGAFIPDAKGDFLQPSEQDLDLKQFLIKNGRNVEVQKIDELKLESVDHFRRLLNIEDVPKLMISASSEKLSEILDLALASFSDEKDRLVVQGENAITLDKFLQVFNSRIELCYAGKPAELDKRKQAAQAKQTTSYLKLKNKFDSVLKRFTEGQDINQMVDDILQKGKIYFLDVKSYEGQTNTFILEVLYRRFRRRASHFFQSKHFSNAIVYVDEANRFIPQSPRDDRKELAAELIDGIKTTRQYGLAWWFADQRPAAISKDAFTQLGTYFFGKGMTAAADRDNMESIIGKEGVQIYEYVTADPNSKSFVASGQFVGLGGEDAVPIPLNFFGTWNEMIKANNNDFDTFFTT